LDAFGVHGVGGIVGALALTFFIRDSWWADAAAVTGGSWTVWQQLGVQATAVGIAIAYAAVGTFIIIFAIDKLVGFKAKTDDELRGLDHSFHGERGYGMLNPN
jgi:Amt family ammonium transporter